MIDVANVKKKLRLSNDKFNDEIQDNINSCMSDMELVGVNTTPVDSELIDKAIELYCKWQFDYMGKGERFESNYKSLRDTMSLTETYGKGKEAQNG